MNDEIKLETLETDGGSVQNNVLNVQEQSTAAPTVLGEGNGAEQPVAESIGTNELNDGTWPSKKQ